MNIIENQRLWFETVLSYRARLEKRSLIPMLEHLKENVSVLGLEIADSIVFSVYEEISEEEKTIIGVEFIVPVNKQFSSNCHYVFKSNFRLENAVLFKYCGKVSELFDVRKSLCEYIVSKNFTALTNIYYLVKQYNDEGILADAYMGINGNSL